jgi:hypothetical protein
VALRWPKGYTVSLWLWCAKARHLHSVEANNVQNEVLEPSQALKYKREYLVHYEVEKFLKKMVVDLGKHVPHPRSDTNYHAVKDTSYMLAKARSTPVLYLKENRQEKSSEGADDQECKRSPHTSLFNDKANE